LEAVTNVYGTPVFYCNLTVKAAFLSISLHAARIIVGQA
jgi:hypothetical protein